MSSSEVSIEEARKRLGDYINAALLTGTVTIITRNGRPAARIAPLETAMSTTTTEYGTWNNYGDASSVRVEDSVAAFLNEFADDYDFNGLVRAYRDAINEALPEDVSLNGDNFYGPYPLNDRGGVPVASGRVPLDALALRVSVALAGLLAADKEARVVLGVRAGGEQASDAPKVCSGQLKPSQRTGTRGHGRLQVDLRCDL